MAAQKNCQSPFGDWPFSRCGQITSAASAGSPAAAAAGAALADALAGRDSALVQPAGDCCCQVRNLFSSSRAWAAFLCCTGGAGLAWGCDQPCAPRPLSFWLAAPCGGRGVVGPSGRAGSATRGATIGRCGRASGRGPHRPSGPFRLHRTDRLLRTRHWTFVPLRIVQGLRPRAGLFGAHIHRLPLFERLLGWRGPLGRNYLAVHNRLRRSEPCRSACTHHASPHRLHLHRALNPRISDLPRIQASHVS